MDRNQPTRRRLATGAAALSIALAGAAWSGCGDDDEPTSAEELQEQTEQSIDEAIEQAEEQAPEIPDDVQKELDEQAEQLEDLQGGGGN